MKGALRDVRFSMSDVDQILHATEPTAPFLRLHNNGFVPEEAYVEIYNDLGSPRRRVIPAKFYGLLKAGATMILNRVDGRSPLIRALCLDVAQFTSNHTLANGYMAFGQKASFGKHWDCHDVFAVQLHGRKRWQLYKPTFELPLASQTSKDVKGECPEVPELDIILETGDVLYIPRGWWHCATPIGEETFHVAIGVHPAFITDYVTWLCSTKLPEFVSCRRSLSFDSSNAQNIQAAMADVLAAMESEGNLAEYMGLISNSDRVHSPYDLRQGVSNAAPALHPDTVIKMNKIYPCTIDGAGPIVINGSVVELGAQERRTLRALAEGQHVTLADLQRSAGDDGANVVQTLHTLVAQDLVQLLPKQH